MPKTHRCLLPLCLFVKDAAKGCLTLLEQDALSQAFCQNSIVACYEERTAKTMFDVSATRLVVTHVHAFCEHAQKRLFAAYLPLSTTDSTFTNNHVHLLERVSTLCREPETLAMRDKRVQKARVSSDSKQ